MHHSARVAALAFMTSVASLARGQVTTPGQLQTEMQACLNAPATATLEVGARAISVSTASGTGYLETGCGQYVVDFNVSSSALKEPPPPQNTQWLRFGFRGGDPAIPIDKGDTPVPGVGEAACLSISEDVSVFKKEGGSFKKLFAYARKGVWHSGTKPSCSMKAFGQYYNQPTIAPPSAGTDTYRMIERSTRKGKARAVFAEIERGSAIVY